MTDDYDEMLAAEFLAMAPPSGAARLLLDANLAELFAIEWDRGVDLATLQPHPFEWCEDWRAPSRRA